MIRHPSALILVYISFVLEATGVAADSRGIEPQWLLLAAGYLAWMLPTSQAVLYGGVCGLLADALSPGPLGAGVAVFSLAVWCAGSIRHDRRRSSGVAFLLTTFTLAVVCVLGTTTLEALLNRSALVFSRTALLIVAGQGVMTALWSGGLWVAVRMVCRVFERVMPPLNWRKVGGE